MTRPTIAVAGFERCGSTMTMTMLHAGGIEPVEGTMLGSYEIPVAQFGALDPAACEGRSLKVLDLWRHVTMPRLNYRFVWLDRDPVQQARSAVKLLTSQGLNLGPWPEHRLERSYRDDRPKVLTALRKIGPVEVMTFDRILANPRRAARTLARVCEGFDFDQHAAAAVVMRRSPQCLPSLAVEEALTRRAAR